MSNERFSHVVVFSATLVVFVVLSACTEVSVQPISEESHRWDEELSVGLVDDPDDMKADGWGHALECKDMPYVQPLTDPAIVISLDGLTLHLIDRAGTYDRVFPVGVGAVEDGESLTPVSTNRSEGVFYTRTDLAPTFDGPTPAQAQWGWNQQCRIWWTDEDGERVPVFAGLPFIRLQGPSSSGYGIHGPIDRYRQTDGGDLRRGYVSHGCIRMEAADLAEVYGRISGSRAPVRIQEAIERRSDGRAVDVEDPWLMGECQQDTDCESGLFCHDNPYSGRGFCTQTCTKYCPDRYGMPTTFCVTDPDVGGQGICMFHDTDLSNHCGRFDHFVPVASVSRFNQSWYRRDVCMPGTEGWIGDRCLADHDCIRGYCDSDNANEAGLCTESCSRYCPDLDGHAVTFCIENPQNQSAGICTARCVSDDDCSMGSTCQHQPRFSQSWVTRWTCVPE